MKTWKYTVLKFIYPFFFSKNQTTLAEAHCSYFFSEFQAHLFLFCSCSCEVQPGDLIELEDNVTNRSSNAPLVGKKIRGLYENGWFKGESIYHNNSLGEYHISFNDGTSDYVKTKEIDGVQFVLL